MFRTHNDRSKSFFLSVPTKQNMTDKHAIKRLRQDFLKILTGVSYDDLDLFEEALRSMNSRVTLRGVLMATFNRYVLQETRKQLNALNK